MHSCKLENAMLSYNSHTDEARRCQSTATPDSIDKACLMWFDYSYATLMSGRGNGVERGVF